MTLISLEDAKAEVRKVVSDFKTRYDINYRLNSLPSIELEDEAEQTEPQTHEIRTNTHECVKDTHDKTEPQTDCETCKHYNPDHEAIACERCLDGKYSRYEPQTEDKLHDYCKKRNCVWWSRSLRICLAERNGLVCKYKSGKE